LGLYEILHPYFYKLQFWHLLAGSGIILILTGWHVEKWKLDRENADLIAYDKAMKEIEKKEKQERKKGEIK